MLLINPRNRKHLVEMGYEIPSIKYSNGKYKTPRGTRIEIKVSDLTQGSSEKVTKICDICEKLTKNQSYGDILKRRARGDGKDRCYKCSLKPRDLKIKNNIPYSKTIACKFPHLSKEWNTIKNGDLQSNKVSYGSVVSVWWICPSCNSDYEMSPNTRTSQSQRCPYCRGLRVNHTNCLANLRPDLMLEWNYELNEITPFEITVSSGKNVWWKCTGCGSDYEKNPNRRNDGEGCPYCHGIKINHTNSLATTYPHLLNEWDFEKNEILGLSPDGVTFGTDKRAWWVCQKCNHSWETSIVMRSSGGRGCPQCKESKGEQRVRSFLESHSIKFEKQYEFDDLIGLGGGNLRFDFAVLDDKDQLLCLIEYDGEFHFKKIYEEDSHEVIVIHDKLKNDFCKKHEIKLIRIPFTEFENIEDIISEYIFSRKFSKSIAFKK